MTQKKNPKVQQLRSEAVVRSLRRQASVQIHTNDGYQGRYGRDVVIEECRARGTTKLGESLRHEVLGRLDHRWHCQREQSTRVLSMDFSPMQASLKRADRSDTGRIGDAFVLLRQYVDAQSVGSVIPLHSGRLAQLRL